MWSGTILHPRVHAGQPAGTAPGGMLGNHWPPSHPAAIFAKIIFSDFIFVFHIGLGEREVVIMLNYSGNSNALGVTRVE